MKTVTLRFLILLMPLLVFSGCSKHSRYYKNGVDALQRESYDEAVLDFSRALQKKPGDPESQARFLTASARAALEHLDKGRRLRGEGLLVEAASEMRLAYTLDRTLVVAQSELSEIEQLQKTAEMLSEAESQYRARHLPQAKKLVEQILDRDPANATALLLLEQIRADRNIMVGGFELAVESREPITLKFKDAKLQEVFKILNKLSGINFIFDEDLANESVTLLLEDATFAQALELLMKMNDLGSRVLNPKTVIIYSNTKEKQKQYEDQVIQTFYLSNIDAKKAVNMLRTMLTLRKVYVHEELNALVVRDTPDVIKLVAQMLETADLSDSEVLFDLELIEVTQGDLQTLGLRLSDYSVNAGAFKGGSLVSGSISDGANLLSNLRGLDVLFTLPTATFDLSKTLTDTDILATPKIRVKNREKAKVHVGSREPTLTSTTSGTSDFVSSSVQYIDVGVKVDVEPTIQLDGSVMTKLRLEVSSKGDQLTSDNAVAFTINTTNAETVLILKDGERTIIGGLIRSFKTKTRNTIPILGDIPLLGALFTNYDTNDTKREILLSVTPHIVKNIALPGVDAARIWSGGEEELKAGQNFAAFAEEPEPVELKPTSEVKPKVLVPVTALPPSVESTLTEPEVVEPVEKPTTVVQPELAEPVETSATVVQPEEVAPLVVEFDFVEPDVVVDPSGVPVELMSDASIEGPPPVPRVFFTGTQMVKVGDEFFLELQVSDVENLSSAPLFVNYDQQLISYVRTEEGDFLKQSGQPTIFTSSPNPSRGELILGSKQGVGGDGANGSGTLARIYFKATAPGTAVVRPNRVNFRSAVGTRLKTEVEPFLIEIK